VIDPGGARSVSVRLKVVEDAEAVARAGASEMASGMRAAVEDSGSCSIAVSGGTTPWAMFARLGEHDIPWGSVGIWQVDERIVPEGDPDRGLAHLRRSLPAQALGRIRAMPVDGIDLGDDLGLSKAAEAYAEGFPEAFDLIHLGLGDDGHTASLVPGDPVIEVIDRDVAITANYRGHRRMTLTFPVLDRARSILWITQGGTKATALRRLLERDPSIPAARVAASNQLAIVDRDVARAIAAER
jgi:6-phosphogluconolactonase